MGIEGNDQDRTQSVAEAVQSVAGIRPKEPALLLLAGLLGLDPPDDEARPAGGAGITRNQILEAMQPVIEDGLTGDKLDQARILWAPGANPDKLSVRQDQAAAIVERKGDGWRQESWGALCLAVAELLVASAGDGGQQLTERRRAPGWRRPTLALGLILALLSVVAWVVVGSDGDDEPTAEMTSTTPPTTRPTDACSAAVGETDADAPPALVEAGRTIEATRFDTPIRCAAGRVTSMDTSFGERIHQEVLVDGNDEPAAITISTGGDAVLLRSREWNYILHAEPEGFEVDQAEYYGRLRSRVEVDGGIILSFESENILTYPFADGPDFFVYGPAADFWRDNGAQSGRMGWPMSDAYLQDGLFHQQFQGGYGFLGDAGIEFVELEPGSGLPPRDQLPGRIIQTPGNRLVSWVVTDDLELTWVETGDEYFECGGDAARLTDEPLPGAALTGLEFAGVAECDG